MPELHRILQVEDDADIQAVVKMALEALGGFEVQLAASGRDAVAAALRNPPDLILLDVMMPGMNGPDTLASLRREPQLAAIPVIFMTAKVQPTEIAGYLELGVIGVIAKPFDALTLAATVRDLWDTWAAGA